jgi:cell wall-associated NlpC family hydrolase
MINRLHIPLVIFSLAAPPFALGANASLPVETKPTASVTESPSTAASSPPPATNPTSYTSVKGDTFSSVGEKFGCSVRSLKKFNGIKGTHLKVGTILQIPARKVASHTATKGKTKSSLGAAAQAKLDRQAALAAAIKATNSTTHHHHQALVAQPVQDFDLSPSEYASCPVPPSNGSEPTFAAATDEGTQVETPPATAPSEDGYPAPLVATNHRASLLPVPDAEPIATPSSAENPPETGLASRSGSNSFSVYHQTPAISSTSTAVLTPPAEPRKSLASAISNFFGGSRGLNASESGAWGNRFLSETRELASQGIPYDGSWRPDGESRSWEMDCSNTTRYLYQVTAGISLPRTASDQYYYLHLQDKAWDVPMNSAGFADCNFLRSNLKPGDLLFWQNTYRPERQPPITHVMIFLGTDARGRWLMAGSQGSRGFYNRRRCGPDVYVFDPTHYVGGYTTWLGLVRHRGQFVAYGRPLEADVKKLSVATNE